MLDFPNRSFPNIYAKSNLNLKLAKGALDDLLKGTFIDGFTCGPF